MLSRFLSNDDRENMVDVQHLNEEEWDTSKMVTAGDEHVYCEQYS